MRASIAHMRAYAKNAATNEMELRFCLMVFLCGLLRAGLFNTHTHTVFLDVFGVKLRELMLFLTEAFHSCKGRIHVALFSEVLNFCFSDHLESRDILYP